MKTQFPMLEGTRTFPSAPKPFCRTITVYARHTAASDALRIVTHSAAPTTPGKVYTSAFFYGILRHE